MTVVSPDEVRAFVLRWVSDQLDAMGVRPDEVPDDFDLLFQGAIDSLGLLQLIAAIEERFGTELDFDGLEPGNLAVVGPFSRYIAELASGDA